MFVNQGRLPHLLSPDDYVQPRAHQQEQSAIFGQSWQLVGSTAQVEHSGDFLTTEVAGLPVVVFNFDGELRAFLNVCVHRHCRLVSEPRGRAATLTCPYHGWQYDAHGWARRIPDGRSCRPLHLGEERLRQLEVETLGRLLFVGPRRNQPGLRSCLGAAYPRLAAMFDAAATFEHFFSVTCDANWKVPVENSLESYHLPLVHPETFGAWPEEHEVTHTLEEQFTAILTPMFTGARWSQRVQAFVCRRLRAKPSFQYTHIHCFPNHMFVATDLHTMAMTVRPTGPQTCVYDTWLFSRRPDRHSWLTPLVYQTARVVVRRAATRVLAEDHRLYRAIQQGLQHSPFPGLLTAREERIWAFQSWLRARLTDPDRPGQEVIHELS